MKSSTVYAQVITAACFWGANFVLAGPVLADMTPLWAAALRFVLGALLMLVIVRWQGESLAAAIRAHAGVYLLLGAVGIGAFNILFFYALRDTSAANASLIMATNPLLTTLLAALLLGEQPGARHLAGIPLALIGVTVVISAGDWTRLAALHVARGDVLMLAANLAWALYNVLGRRYMPRDASSVVNTTLVMTAGAVLLFAVALGSAVMPAMPGIQAMVALLIMTVAGTVLAYLFWNNGIALLGASRTALFLNFVPVFAMLIGAVTGVLPTLAQLAGGLLVIGGISLSMLPQRKLAVS